MWGSCGLELWWHCASPRCCARAMRQTSKEVWVPQGQAEPRGLRGVVGVTAYWVLCLSIMAFHYVLSVSVFVCSMCSSLRSCATLGARSEHPESIPCVCMSYSTTAGCSSTGSARVCVCFCIRHLSVKVAERLSRELVQRVGEVDHLTGMNTQHPGRRREIGGTRGTQVTSKNTTRAKTTRPQLWVLG